MEYTRNCPTCRKTIVYRDKYVRNLADKKQTKCPSCTFKGENNPFYGKKHSKETIKTIKEKRNKQIITDSHKENLRRAFIGKKNPMYGKSVYNIWVEKYGKSVADKKQKIANNKRSVALSGEKNHFFGKPLPKGVGAGWGSWYKDIYFRSLGELAFFLEFIDGQNIQWEIGEQEKYKIEYSLPEGKITHYYPDFIIGNTMYECKPKSLWNILPNKLKREAAINFCKGLGLKYKMIEVIPNFDKIHSLFKNEELKFDKKTLPKYLKLLKKNS